MRERMQAVRDFVAGFAKRLFIYLNRLRIELLGGGIVVPHKGAGAEGLKWHGNHGRKGAVKLLDNLELAGVRSIGGGKVLSHVLVPELVEGGNEARVMRLSLLGKLDRFLVFNARNIEAPLGGGRRTGLHGLVQLHGQIRRRARRAQARFQCGSLGGFARGPQGGEMLVETRLGGLVLCLGITGIGALDSVAVIETGAVSAALWY